MKKLIGLFVVMTFLLISPNFVQGQNVFVSVDGIKGTSLIKGYNSYFEVESFSQGSSREVATAGTGRSRSKVNFGDAVIMKNIDAASPKLMEFIAQGKNIPKVEVHFTKNSRGVHKPYLTYTFEKASLTSHQVSGGAGGGVSESFSLSYEKLTVSYYATDRNGIVAASPTVSFTYDLVTGK